MCLCRGALEADPGELADVAAANRPVTETMQTLLLESFRKTRPAAEEAIQWYLRPRDTS